MLLFLLSLVLCLRRLLQWYELLDEEEDECKTWCGRLGLIVEEFDSMDLPVGPLFRVNVELLLLQLLLFLEHADD